MPVRTCVVLMALGALVSGCTSVEGPDRAPAPDAASGAIVRLDPIAPAT